MRKQKSDIYSEYARGVIETLVNEVMAKISLDTEFWPESWRLHLIIRMAEEMPKIAIKAKEMEL